SYPARLVRGPNGAGGAQPGRGDRRAARALQHGGGEPAKCPAGPVRSVAGAPPGLRVVMKQDLYSPRLRDLNATAVTEAATFGARLKQLRVAAGLSQETLAERAGLSAAAVSALERGTRRAPQRATLAALVSALDLPNAEQAELELTVRRERSPRDALDT